MENKTDNSESQREQLKEESGNASTKVHNILERGAEA